MKPEISIILPAIRVENWDALYDSICLSTSRKFELIICGPYALTEKLQSLTNVKYVKDFGSPTRASAIASLLAEGKLITWVTDDAIMIKDSLDMAINLLYSMGDNYKNVIISKYLEGQTGRQKTHQPDYYFKINGRPGFRPCSYSPHISDDWWIFNTAIMYRQFFEELGGLDCNFEHAAMADTDFAIRAQVADANVKMTQVLMYDCDHGQADHKPIEIAQVQFDEPRLQTKYRDPEWKEKIETNININNWKDFPIVWERRFTVKE
tara:strand:- start:90 stop:884 length:795 start_codon:yes stop_codon:yes gene_type:complete